MAEGQPPPPQQQQQQQQFDSSKWPVVYPAYIDAGKTIALVRRRRAPAYPSAAAARCVPARCLLLSVRRHYPRDAGSTVSGGLTPRAVLCDDRGASCPRRTPFRLS